MTTTLPLWSVTTMRPSGVSADDLGVAKHIAQCYILGRAKSRAEFARKLIAAGLDHRSPAAVSRWIAQWGSETRNAADLAAVTDDRLYARAMTGNPGNRRYVPVSGAQQ